jgi:hypothetical protein
MKVPSRRSLVFSDKGLRWCDELRRGSKGAICREAWRWLAHGREAWRSYQAWRNAQMATLVSTPAKRSTNGLKVTAVLLIETPGT